MRGKEDLFHLIQEMSRSEKRYFTLDAQKSGSKGSKYLKLFQLINGMDEYDETKLKKKFPKNLSADKAYLYDAILRAMRDYRSSKSYTAQIKEKLLDFRYLHELGLYDQCEERLKEAKELAKELGSTNALLEINYEERRLSNDLKRKEYEKEIEVLIKEKDIYLKQLELELHYLDIYNWLLPKIVKRKEYQKEERKEELRQAFLQRFKEDDNSMEDLSIHAIHNRVQCLGLFHSLMQDKDKMYKYFKAAVDWWNDNLKYKEEEHYRYILDLSNLLYASFLKEKFDDIPLILEKLENSENSNIHNSVISKQNLANYRLMYHINTGKLEGATEFIERLAKDIETMRLTNNVRMVLIFNIAFLCFIMEDFKKCIDWTNKVIKNYKVDYRQDIQKAVRILNLIANYEIDNFDKVELSIRAYERFYREKTDLNREDFEYKMLFFGKKLLSTTSEKKILSELKDYLIAFRDDSNNLVSLGLHNLFLHWVESKLKRVTIATLISTRKEGVA